jgi:shikimate kinase
MGSGKTTIGRLLADELGWKFIDLDTDIENAANRKISEIFDADGEAEFRRQEHAALVKRVHGVQGGHPLVMSLGGGTFAQDENYELLSENGISIWLDAPFALIQERIAGQDHRPLARDPEQFSRLYEERRAAYGRADYRVAIESNDAAAAVKAIVEFPLF